MKQNDKYLLIKGNRIDQYQPVGGVYKYFSSFKGLKNKLEITDEQVSSFYENNDLRIRTRGKHIKEFLTWFNSRKNREVSVNRELIEEIGLTDDINKRIIKETKVEYIKQIKEPISYSKHFQVDELKIFDIFDLEIPADLISTIVGLDNVILVGKDEIEKECVFLEGTSKRIAMTAKYIL